MLIQNMTRQACIGLLAHNRLGRLACAQDGQPYITPHFFVCHDDLLYSFSTLGRKIEWMRANPLVCVEMDDIQSPANWMSVVVLGRYEELPNTVEYEALRTHAYDLLHRNPMWWEPAYVKTVLQGEARALEPIYFRIHIVEITGHRASSNSAMANAQNSHAERKSSSWLGRVFGAFLH